MTDESGTWNRPERTPADSPENKKEARQACVAQSEAARGNSAVCLPCSSCGMTHPVSLRCPVPLPGEGEWKCTGWDGQEPTYERVEATAEPSAAPTDSGANQTEGEGEKAKRFKLDASQTRVVRAMAGMLYELATEGGKPGDFQKEKSPFTADCRAIAEDAAEAALRSSWGVAYQHPSRSDGEGELRARIEKEARKLEALVEAQTDEFGNFITGRDGMPGQYKEGRADAYDEAARRLRSLLVPKEEA